MIVVLGIDPGFAAIGLATVRIDAEGETPLFLEVVHTEKVARKTNTLASDDNLRRAREIAAALKSILDRIHVVAFAAESMSFPRHAGTAAKIMMAWGVIAAVSEQNGIPIVQASPQAIKKCLCGVKNASKEDVQGALISRYGDIIERLSHPLNKADFEHAFDALGAVVATLDSDVIRFARKMV